MTGLIRLRSGDAWADISSEGAEIRRWDVAGQPLLWEADLAIWAETAPILFPVVGWTRNGEVRVAGHRYPLGLHGFARQKPFRVASLAEDRVRLILDTDPQTLSLYPFDFRFSVDYRLDGPALSIGLSISNRGAEPMPYACGLHPGFRWPLVAADRAEHRIIFDTEEASFVPEITPHGLFSPRLRPVPLTGAELVLAPGLFAREALCFLDAKSRGLTYEDSDGASLRVEMRDFPHIALWSKPEAPFLAIELWTGYGDPEGFDGDLRVKPSMRLLPPEAEANHAARFTFRPGNQTEGRGSRLVEGLGSPAQV